MSTKPEDIKTKFQNSGNRFHYEVVDYLQKKGWHVKVGQYYNDPYSNKPREIDILSEKTYPVNNWSGFLYLGEVVVQLLIECKYQKEGKSTLFSFDKIDKHQAVKFVGRTFRIDDFKEYSVPAHKTHYLPTVEQEVAKLSQTENSNDSDGDVFFKAMSQLLNATQALPKTSISPKEFHRNLHTIRYNIIVCSNFDNLFKVYRSNSEDIEKINENFIQEVNYTFSGDNEFFLVDIVDFNKFDSFLETIEKTDIMTLKRSIQNDDEFSRQNNYSDNGNVYDGFSSM